MRMHIPPTYSSNRHTPAQVVAGMQLRNRPLLLKDAHSGAGKSEEMVVGGDDELADDELAGDDAGLAGCGAVGDDAGLAGCGAVHGGATQAVEDEPHDGAELRGGGAAQAVGGGGGDDELADELADDELAGDDAGLAGCSVERADATQAVEDEPHDGAELRGGGAAQAVGGGGHDAEHDDVLCKLADDSSDDDSSDGESEETEVGGDDGLADDELAGDDAGLAGCGAVHDGGAQTVDDEPHDGAERHGGGAAQAVDAPSCDIDKPTANALCHEFQVVDGEIMHGSVSATVVARALAGHQCDIVRPTPLNEHLAACSDVHRSSLGLVCVCPESEWKGGRRNKLLVYTVYNARRSTHGGGSDTWTFDMFFARSDHE